MFAVYKSTHRHDCGFGHIAVAQVDEGSLEVAAVMNAYGSSLELERLPVSVFERHYEPLAADAQALAEKIYSKITTRTSFMVVEFLKAAAGIQPVEEEMRYGVPDVVADKMDKIYEGAQKIIAKGMPAMGDPDPDKRAPRSRMARKARRPAERSVIGDIERAKAKAPKKPGIGSFVENLLREGKQEAAILAAVKQQFPSAKTSPACVGWYRNRLVKTGELKK